MPEKNIVVELNRKYDWVVFADSYLSIAKLACQEILDQRTNKHNKSSSEFVVPYGPADLFVAIIFNIKHGIEVFIKTLSIFAYGQYDEGHDVVDLFKIAKKKIVNVKFEPMEINKYLKVTKTDIDSLPNNLESIEKLVNYFYSLDFVREKLGNHYSIKDVQNDIFRYPDNKASIIINWDTVLDSRIDHTDINSILQKIIEISDLFNKCGYMFALYEDIKRRKNLL